MPFTPPPRRRSRLKAQQPFLSRRILFRFQLRPIAGVPLRRFCPRLYLPCQVPLPPLPTTHSCNSTFVADATIPDNTVMSPGQTFVKTWTLQNTGTCTWDTSFTMRFFSGDQMSGGSGTVSSAVAPGQQGNVSVTLTAPLTAGTYTGNWRLADNSGITFGEIVDVVIDVNGSVTETPANTATDTPGTFTPAPTATLTPILVTTPVPAIRLPQTHRYACYHNNRYACSTVHSYA